MSAETAEVREAAGRWLSEAGADHAWPGVVRGHLLALRRQRQFDLLLRVAEVAARTSPREPELRRLQAQGLIEAGHLSAALDVLDAAGRDLLADHKEAAEIAGLKARALKQAHVDAFRAGTAGADDFLRRAQVAYRAAWETGLRPYWHGVNALALRVRARRLGLSGHDAAEDAALGREVFDRAPAIDDNGAPDHFGLATRFEAALAFDLVAARTHLQAFVASSPPPFNVGSLLRQLDEIWTVPNGGRELEPFVTAIRAYHASLPAAEVPPISARDVAAFQRMGTFEQNDLEAIFGPDGPQTMQWWTDGLAAAKSVCAVIAPDGRRIGTGFALSAKRLCDAWDDAVVVLTNFHVCNRDGVSPGLHVDDAMVEFSAVGDARYRIAGVRCESVPGELDYAVLDLAPAPVVPVLPVPRALPVIDRSAAAAQARVFVIGHPDGRGLEFSVQNSFLLDVEDARDGEVRRRLHYSTPTEKGSSGSPVFRSDQWAVIALHHAGGELRRLNGQPGTYQANEGIALLSIRSDIAARVAAAPPVS